MKELKVVVKNKLGLHARAAAMLVESIAKYFSDVSIIKDDQEIDGKSIMGIMTLAAGMGTELLFKVDGEDEKEVINEINNLFERKFDEE